LQPQDPSYPSDQIDGCCDCQKPLIQVWYCQWLQLPPPLSLILFGNSHSQCICNDQAGFWIMVRGRKAFKIIERSGSSSNAGWGVGYDAMR
jgi:hypothetical protein